MMDKKTLKLLKYDTLDTRTLEEVLEIVGNQIGTLHMIALFNGNKGDYSPTKVKAREEEIRNLGKNLRGILEGIEALETKGV
jgi:hypothetical protein